MMCCQKSCAHDVISNSTIKAQQAAEAQTNKQGRAATPMFPFIIASYLTLKFIILVSVSLLLKHMNR